MELNIHQPRWSYCLAMLTLGCHQASGEIVFANPILTAQESRRFGYYAREPCPDVTLANNGDTPPLTTVLHDPSAAASPAPVALVTQLSMDRMQMLTMLRAQWAGPLHVAVFLGEPQASASWKVKYVTKHLSALPADQGPTQATLVFPATARAASVRYSRWLKVGTGTHCLAVQVYPINALRNIALKQGASDWLLYLDADFVPSPDLSVCRAARQPLVASPCSFTLLLDPCPASPPPSPLGH